MLSTPSQTFSFRPFCPRYFLFSHSRSHSLGSRQPLLRKEAYVNFCSGQSFPNHYALSKSDQFRRNLYAGTLQPQKVSSYPKKFGDRQDEEAESLRSHAQSYRPPFPLERTMPQKTWDVAADELKHTKKRVAGFGGTAVAGLSNTETTIMPFENYVNSPVCPEDGSVYLATKSMPLVNGAASSQNPLIAPVLYQSRTQRKDAQSNASTVVKTLEEQECITDASSSAFITAVDGINENSPVCPEDGSVYLATKSMPLVNGAASSQNPLIAPVLYQSRTQRKDAQSNASTVVKTLEEQECITDVSSSAFITAADGINGKPANTTSSRTKYDEDTSTDTKESVQKLRKRLSSIYGEVLIVDEISVARQIVRKLTTEYRHLVHACDTEVANIDVKQDTPVNHGEVICFSIYSGPDAEYGSGKSCIWVDVLDGGGREILREFAPFFEDPSIKKVWHNYSFDSHVIENYGIKVSGFHADTMHMARLWDSSRRTEGGYSLEALTHDRNVMAIQTKSKVSADNSDGIIGKVSMKTIFGRKKLKKDRSEGKITIIPSVEELQREEREPWICYSALDSISTLKLYDSLKNKLEKKRWKLDGQEKGTMFDFYELYWKPFGEILVRMEAEGMLVDRKYLAEIEKVATAEQQVAANRFRNWASSYCPDAKYMNVGSDTQLRQLFFGGTCNSKNIECIPEEKTFKVPNVDNVIEEGKKTATKFRNITLKRIAVDMPTDLYTASGWPSMSGDALKTFAGKVAADFDFKDDAEPQPVDVEGTEIISDENLGAQEEIISDLDTSAYGTAYNSFGGGQSGREACHAIAALCQVCSIDSLISNFILPLQGSHISGSKGRIHCSLNINTETGRLSARRPNLQNQPALEKDRYKIRQAFIASPGNSLIVADYGQLELRILAHLANCKSMLDAFKAGGDFHSRTAMNMYPHIREAVDKQQVLLEWHPQPGEDKPPVPLLKDAFGSERRKAKMLNFSIAYGKTPIGLARDWKVSVREAKETVDRWYSDRKEVLTWQDLRKKEARTFGCVHTLLGRSRLFPSLASASNSLKNHIDRAAINTPVQGSAADVAMCAMLEITRNERLKELGWKLLLQVHDEVILEGPTESAEIAKAIVVECMAKPFDGKNILKVDLAVDAKCAGNWYSAK